MKNATLSLPTALLALAPSAAALDLLDETLTILDVPPPGSSPFETHYYAGAAWADVDGDTYLDLFVTDYFGPNRLYVNTAKSFSPTGRVLVYAPDAIDGDGLLDIYVTNYGDPGDPFDPGAPNHLYENVGGVFVEVTMPVGGPALADAASGTFGARWIDVDEDGDVDLFFGGASGVFAYRNVPDAGRTSTTVTLGGAGATPMDVSLAGHGAHVRAFVDSLADPATSLTPRWRQKIDAGSGYAQCAPEIVIGRATSERVAELEVTWKPGATETLFALPAGSPFAPRHELDVEFPAGVESYGIQTDPEPLELWRHGVGGSFPAPSLGETDFALAARWLKAGAFPYLAVGLTEVSIPLMGGDLLVLPILVVPGTVLEPGVAQWPFALPTTPTLEGSSVRFQAASLDPPAGEVHWSNGVKITWQP